MMPFAAVRARTVVRNYAILVLILALVHSQGLCAVEDDLQLTLATSRSKYFLGEPVDIALTLTNTGVANISGDLYLTFDFDRLQIWTSAGGGPFVESQSEGAQIATGKRSGADQIGLPPGGSTQSNLLVSYDALTADFVFPQSGQYDLKATLRFNHYQNQIETNVLTLTIADPLPADQSALDHIRTNNLEFTLTPERDFFTQSLDPNVQQQILDYIALFPTAVYTQYVQDAIVPPAGTDLSIQKVDLTDPAVTGTTLTYDLTVTNSGPNEALAVVITDPVPADLTFDPNQSDPACSEAAGTITCSVPSLAALDSTVLSLGFSVVATAGCLATNTASVTTSTLPDPDTRDNAHTQSTILVPPTLFQAGEVFLHFGPTLTGGIGLTEPVPEASTWFGSAVAFGDVNGDGLDDLVIGAPLADAGGDANVGEVHVFLGPDMIPLAVLSESMPKPNHNFGNAVAVGDVDNDGFGDVIVGANNARVGGSDAAGKVWVFFGPALTSSDTLQEPSREAQARFGSAVASGDINNDGFADVIVATPGATVSDPIGDSARAGEVYVFLGPSLGTEIQLANPVPNLNDAFGGGGVAAGDVDGDGNDEVVIGAPTDQFIGAGGGLTDHGAVYVYFGPGLIISSVLTEPVVRAGARFGTSVATGDIDGDGLKDVLVGALNLGHALSGVPATAGELFAFKGPTMGSVITQQDPSGMPGLDFGRALVAGDFDGDGDDDVVVGSPQANPAGLMFAGRATVFWGPDLASAATLTEPVPELGARFSREVAAGDVNGDGQDELLVGARSAGAVIGSGGVCAAGGLPDGGSVPGSLLTAGHGTGSDIVLAWGASCLVSDTDYAVYEGVIGSFTSHLPKFCSTSGLTTITLTPAAASSYYIVVPRNGSREGSYGTDSTGTQRLQGSAFCLPQAIATCP